MPIYSTNYSPSTTVSTGYAQTTTNLGDALTNLVSANSTTTTGGSMLVRATGETLGKTSRASTNYTES